MIDRDGGTPERDHLTPADLLSDDPEESVDPTAIRARTQNAIGTGTCAALRDALRDTDRTAADVKADLDIEGDTYDLRRHYRGRCAHDHDSPPVRWDHEANRWRTDA